MSEIDDLAARLERVETLGAFQEKAIEDLNQTITDQWKEIESLRRLLARLDDQMRDVAAAVPQQPDRPPPHY